MMSKATIHRALLAYGLPLGLLTATVGCGDANDQELMGEHEAVETEAAASTVTISCPSLSRATWIQAANGRVDLIAGQTRSFGFPIGGEPTTTLQCFFNTSASPQVLRHDIQLAPGTVPSACGAKVTFSGIGQQIGGVPQFGGWQYKSKRVTATTSYNQRTGLCIVQTPVVGPPSAMSLKVSNACTPISNGFRCPAGVVPVI